MRRGAHKTVQHIPNIRFFLLQQLKTVLSKFVGPLNIRDAQHTAMQKTANMNRLRHCTLKMIDAKYEQTAIKLQTNPLPK